MSRVGLSRRMAEARNFIAQFIDGHGFSPSYEEIGVALGLQNKSGVARIIDELEERGHIRRIPDKARSITIVEPVDLDGVLSAKTSAALSDYCRRAGERPEAIINDAVALYIDQEEGAVSG
jgi:SOS-response transcriptional repressor LexA